MWRLGEGTVVAWAGGGAAAAAWHLMRSAGSVVARCVEAGLLVAECVVGWPGAGGGGHG